MESPFSSWVSKTKTNATFTTLQEKVQVSVLPIKMLTFKVIGLEQQPTDMLLSLWYIQFT